MAKIDSIYDLSEKALVEIKSWLEPWFLTRARGGTGGGVGPAGPAGPQGPPGAGTGIFWPAADQAHTTNDTTSWANTPDGVGHYDALALDGNNTIVMFAGGYQGDSYPSMLVVDYTNLTDTMGIYWDDGTHDPYFGNGAAIIATASGTPGNMGFALRALGQFILISGVSSNGIPFVETQLAGLLLGPVNTAVGGPGQGVCHYAGKSAPLIGGNVGDKYWRSDGTVGSSTLLYTCTVAGAAGSATWVGIL